MRNKIVMVLCNLLLNHVATEKYRNDIDHVITLGIRELIKEKNRGDSN